MELTNKIFRELCVLTAACQALKHLGRCVLYLDSFPCLSRIAKVRRPQLPFFVVVAKIESITIQSYLSRQTL